MPALGYTVEEETVRTELRKLSATPDEFRRAYLNQWTVGEERVIPAALWAAACAEDVTPSGVLVFGVDVNPDRSAASIAVSDDERRCEVVETGLAPSRLVARVVELATKYEGQVVLDDHGPAAVFADEIRHGGVIVRAYDETQMAQACARLYDWIADGLVHIRRHPVLDAAAAGAKKRITGDTWRWARKDSAVDVGPLIALTMAVDKAAKSQTVWVHRG